MRTVLDEDLVSKKTLFPSQGLLFKGKKAP